MFHMDESPLDPKKVVCFVLVFRVLNALVVRTYFNPDEYWQSLEVAHEMVWPLPLFH